MGRVFDVSVSGTTYTTVHFVRIGLCLILVKALC
jgi:hypothetical protein